MCVMYTMTSRIHPQVHTYAHPTKHWYLLPHLLSDNFPHIPLVMYHMIQCCVHLFTGAGRRAD